MDLQLFGIILLVFIIVGIYVVYKYIKKLSGSDTETFKTRIEKGKDVFK